MAATTWIRLHNNGCVVLQVLARDSIESYNPTNSYLLMKMRPFSMALLAGLIIPLSSCIQADNDNVLNADGSGKFTIKATLDLGPMAGMMGKAGGGEGGAGGLDMGDTGKEMLLGVLAKTKGVDVWKEAKTTKGADGKIKVIASGYYKDVTKFSAGNPMDSMGGKMGGGKASGKGPEIGDIKSYKNDAGDWIVEVPLSGGKDKAEDAPKEAAADTKEKLSPAETKEKVEEMRAQFGAMKPMMQAMLGTMRISQTITVGGEIKDYGMLTKVDAHTAKLEISFNKIFDGMEKLMADDKIAALMASAGGSQADPFKLMKGEDKEGKELAGKMMEAIFGGKGEPKLTIKAGTAAFDYKAESEAAKAGQTPELKKLLEEAAKKAKDDDAGDAEPAPLPKKKAA